MKNNKGQIATVAIVIIAIAVLAIGAGMFFGIGQFSAGDEPTPTSPSSCPESTVTLNFPAFNAEKQGTAVATTVNARVKSANSDNFGSSKQVTASTSFTVGDTVELMHNATNFIDETLDPFVVVCGQTDAPQVELFATSTNSFELIDGTSLLGDSATGTLTNATGSATSVDVDIKILGTSKESTGDMVIVIETNDTEVDSINLGGMTCGSNCASYSKNKPDFHAEEFSGASIFRSFEVPAVINGNSIAGSLKLTAETGKTIGSAATAFTPVYITAYSKQAFVDVDGTFQYGIEDSEGASLRADGVSTIYEDTWDFDFSIQ